MRNTRGIWCKYLFPLLLLSIVCGFKWNLFSQKPQNITAEKSWIKCSLIGANDKYIVFVAGLKHLGPNYLMVYDFDKKKIRRVKKEPVPPGGMNKGFYGNLVVYRNPEKKGRKITERVTLLNINTGEEEILPLPGKPGEPKIWGEKVIYRNYQDNTINLYDLKKKENKVLGKGYRPRISEKWAVWMTTAGVFHAIYLPSGEKKTIELGRVPYNDYALAKGILVASVGKENEEDIYVYDLKKDRKVLVSNLPEMERFVSTDGRYIVWKGEKGLP